MTERKTPRRRSDYAEFHTVQTRWNDNDQYGHVYNVAYLELFDEALNRAMVARGLLDHRGEGPIQVVVELGCTYFREISYPDQPAIGLKLADMGRSSLRVEMGMFRDGDDEECAAAFSVLVTVDSATHRPLPTPQAQRDLLRGLVMPEPG
ncbi:acyl-CoA thioesterase [Paracoccus sp. (in: a-proteobacteria)]|uniref:acyl-CoA thioesterase n=1 Tax=Paracoccus sp. TaxID=267 RepID=UPI003A894394